jgi:hypothetical protein
MDYVKQASFPLCVAFCRSECSSKVLPRSVALAAGAIVLIVGAIQFTA